MARRARGFRILTVLCLLLFPVACTSTAKPVNGTTKIRLVEVTHSIFYAPQYVAMSQGFFKEEGLDIDLTNGNGGDKTMTTLVSNQSDIVLVGAEAGIYVTARTSSQPVVAFAQLTQTDGSFLVSREPIPSFSWSMLKGKTLLGQRRGGMPEMVSEYVQRKNGIEPHRDVEIVQNVAYQNLAPAFASGTGDFVQLFEPFASKLEQEGKGYIVASFGKDSGHVPYTCYLAKKSLLKQNPDLIKRFTRAVYKGQKWVESHSAAEIADVIQEHFPDTDRSILVRVIERYKSQGSYAVDPVIGEEEYQHLLEIMDQAGELPKRVPYEQLIDTEISREAMKEVGAKK
ncbi:ABC transporter substrate-binding protein [Lihuaxuella thermophila]|uniref:NitT/TauT family transport system substrate-binding protein n=1 Tax=Lihuaxuella thermophila TaxID=1173111 RepID=A0A1H8D190_9BACL|nr:ABC transporter substrate-binding protein [Lihuaxuella thermophila]SEN01050.1 NitT/TauT family transport system substrate-binding protein [Lihuaxuella thermophila]